MKKRELLVIILAAVIMLSGCSKTAQKKSTSSKPAVKVDTLQKKQDPKKEDDDYQAALDLIRQQYKEKRTQAKQERQNKYKANADKLEKDRIQEYNSLIDTVKKELDKRNQEEMQKIKDSLQDGQDKINKENLQVADRDKAAQQAVSENAEQEYNQKRSYEDKKVALDRAKRNYETNIKQAQDEKGKNEVATEDIIATKYDEQYEDTASLSVDQYSPWELLFNKEQKEIEAIYKTEEEKYKSRVDELNNDLKKYCMAMANN